MRRGLILILLVLASVVVYATATNVIATGDSAVLNQWTADGGGNKFDKIDDAVGAPDDATTTISETTNNERQLFTYSTPSIPNGAAIDSVRVVTRCINSSGTTDGKINALIYVGGSVATGTSDTLTTSYADTDNTWTTNPCSAAAWTEAQIEQTAGTCNLTEFGVRAVDITAATVTCTQVYLEVNYTAATGATGRLLLLGVGAP